jgi:hypothetical protein
MTTMEAPGRLAAVPTGESWLDEFTRGGVGGQPPVALVGGLGGHAEGSGDLGPGGALRHGLCDRRAIWPAFRRSGRTDIEPSEPSRFTARDLSAMVAVAPV